MEDTQPLTRTHATLPTRFLDCARAVREDIAPGMSACKIVPGDLYIRISVAKDLSAVTSHSDDIDVRRWQVQGSLEEFACVLGDCILPWSLPVFSSRFLPATCPHFPTSFQHQWSQGLWTELLETVNQRKPFHSQVVSVKLGHISEKSE